MLRAFGVIFNDDNNRPLGLQRLMTHSLLRVTKSPLDKLNISCMKVVGCDDIVKALNELFVVGLVDQLNVVCCCVVCLVVELENIN